MIAPHIVNDRTVFIVIRHAFVAESLGSAFEGTNLIILSVARGKRNFKIEVQNKY